MADTEDQKSYYELNGKRYPRVTHILKVFDKPGLARWRGKIGNEEADRISREGSRIGTAFHAVAQEIHAGLHERRGWQPPGELRYMAQAYIDWLHKHVTRIHVAEQTLYSDERAYSTNEDEQGDPNEPLYAGTVDLVAWFRGDTLPSVLDIKTSNNYSDDWALQLSAYRRLLLLNGLEVDKRVVVHVPKTGKPEIKAYRYLDHAVDEAAWLNCVDLWNWQQKGKERRDAALVVAGL